MVNSLVTITSSEENEYVFGLIDNFTNNFNIPNVNEFWIGLNKDSDSDNNWEWANGENFIYENLDVKIKFELMPTRSSDT